LVCTQLLKADEEHRVPTVETSCQQIVDCLVRTAVPAVSGPSVSIIVLLCISSVHLLHDVVVASSA